MPTRVIFGPHQMLPAPQPESGARQRADAITVTGDLDEVARALGSRTDGWAELIMQITDQATARVFVNPSAVRYLREA